MQITYSSSVVAGQAIYFDSGVINSGNAASGSFAVKWEVNGEQKTYGTHNSVPACTTVADGNSQFYWTPAAAGYYTIAFTVDCDNSISEGNEFNNQVSITVYANPAPPPQPQSITVSHTQLTIGVSQGVGVLSASVLPVESNNTVTWVSMNGNVAAVSADGYVYGTGIGSTVIRASTVNGLYADCTVNVVRSGKGVVGISLNKGSASADEGKSIRLSARLSPRSPANRTIAWSSSNPSVASVNGKGTVFCASPGTAVITATASSGISAQCTVRVNSLAVAQVKLSKTYLSVDEGKRATLKASVLPKKARIKTVTWSSSDPSVASVSSKGRITTYKPGTVQITATAHNGVSASCTLVVRSLAVSSITLNKTALTLKTRRSTTIKAILQPKNARFKAVTWISSNPGIVTVSAKGRVKAISPGTATITAVAHNGLSASCSVTVPN